MTFDEARELAAALGLGSDVNARALISDALKAAFDNGLASGQRSPVPGATGDAGALLEQAASLLRGFHAERCPCGTCGEAREWRTLYARALKAQAAPVSTPPAERVTPPTLLPGGREPTRFMVVRKQDTEPWEVTGFPHRGDAEAFYDRASEQWTETYLVAVLKGPPDVVGFAPVPGAERVTVPTGDARDFSGREGEPSSFDLPPSLYRCNHCGATRSSKQLLARLGACKLCGEGTMERVKAAAPAGDAGAPTVPCKACGGTGLYVRPSPGTTFGPATDCPECRSERRPAGAPRVPPGAGDVWRHGEGDGDWTFTGARGPFGWHAHCGNVLSMWIDESFTDGTLTFVRRSEPDPRPTSAQQVPGPSPSGAVFKALAPAGPPCRDCKGTGRASTDTGTGGAAAVEPCVNHQHLACLGPGADNPLCVMKCARDTGRREP